MAQEVLKELDCSIFSYFGHTQILSWNWRKPAKSSLLKKIEKHQRQLINHKGTRMAKDGEDWHRLKMANLKNCRLNFSRGANGDVVPLNTVLKNILECPVIILVLN